jgi:hypothetical protein
LGDLQTAEEEPIPCVTTGSEIHKWTRRILRDLQHAYARCAIVRLPKAVRARSAMPSYTLLYDFVIYIIDLMTFFAVVLVIGHPVYQPTALATRFLI